MNHKIFLVLLAFGVGLISLAFFQFKNYSNISSSLPSQTSYYGSSEPEKEQTVQSNVVIVSSTDTKKFELIPDEYDIIYFQNDVFAIYDKDLTLYTKNFETGIIEEIARNDQKHYQRSSKEDTEILIDGDFLVLSYITKYQRQNDQWSRIPSNQRIIYRESVNKVGQIYNKKTGEFISFLPNYQSSNHDVGTFYLCNSNGHVYLRDVSYSEDKSIKKEALLKVSPNGDKSVVFSFDEPYATCGFYLGCRETIEKKIDCSEDNIVYSGTIYEDDKKAIAQAWTDTGQSPFVDIALYEIEKATESKNLLGVFVWDRYTIGLDFSVAEDGTTIYVDHEIGLNGCYRKDIKNLNTDEKAFDLFVSTGTCENDLSEGKVSTVEVCKDLNAKKYYYDEMQMDIETKRVNISLVEVDLKTNTSSTLAESFVDVDMLSKNVETGVGVDSYHSCPISK